MKDRVIRRNPRFSLEFFQSFQDISIVIIDRVDFTVVLFACSVRLAF